MIIPLGKRTNAASVSSGASMVVHDANDNLIGTYVDMSTGQAMNFLVSFKGYLSILRGKEGMVSYPFSTFDSENLTIYTDSNCTIPSAPNLITLDYYHNYAHPLSDQPARGNYLLANLMLPLQTSTEQHM